MKCLRKPLLSGLLLFLVLLSDVYCLSSEEEAVLLLLPKTTLIEIIKEYDNSLNEIEKEQQKQDMIWQEENKLQIEERQQLEKDKQALIESEASLKIREQIFHESYQMQKQMKKDKFWSGFGYGALTGTLLTAPLTFKLGRM